MASYAQEEEVRRFMAVLAFVAVMFIGAVAAPFDTQVAQAGDGPTSVPWLRVYQIDPLAVGFQPFGTTPYGHAVAIAFDTVIGNIETIEVCGIAGGCSSFPPGYFLGGDVWGNNLQSGWTWMSATPTGAVLQARATMLTPDGRREQILAEPIELQPTKEASNEVWVFIDQAPKKLGETLKLRIERDLGLPVIRSEICLVGSAAWTCMSEDDRYWNMLLNGSGTQKLGLALSSPNIVREGPRGKLISFPNGASIRVKYTMVDGSSVTYQSDPLFFLP